MTSKDGQGSDHDECDQLGEVGEIREIGAGQEEEKQDKDTGQDQGGLDFVKHGDTKEEEVAKEEKGRGEARGLADQEEDHAGHDGQVKGDGRAMEPAGPVRFEVVGGEVE